MKVYINNITAELYIIKYVHNEYYDCYHSEFKSIGISQKILESLFTFISEL